MILQVEFTELDQSFTPDFGEVNNISDGGFERGYEAGYNKGNTEGREQGYSDGHKQGYDSGYEVGSNDGYSKGHTDGLAVRTYETWTITLTDGTIVEKEVALL